MKETRKQKIATHGGAGGSAMTKRSAEDVIAEAIRDALYRDEGAGLGGSQRLWRCRVCSQGWTEGEGVFASPPRHDPACSVPRLIAALVDLVSRHPQEVDNHHNALTCPHCNPKGLQLIDPAASTHPPEQEKRPRQFPSELHR